MNQPFSKEYLHSVLNYTPETGAFIWLYRNDASSAWNTKYSWKNAGCVKKGDGYRFIKINKCRYQEHILAWFYMTGEWPEPHTVDHKNRIPDDNKWCNLRRATGTQQAANRKTSSLNTTGYKGVHLEKRKGYGPPWIARINKKRIGAFACAELAHLVYSEHADKIFGEFAHHESAA